MQKTHILLLSLVVVCSLLLHFNFEQQLNQLQNQTSISLSSLQYLYWGFIGLLCVVLLLESIFIITPLFKQIQIAKADLQNETNHDHLTGLLNHHSFAVIAQQSIAMNQRYKWDLSVIRFEIDQFKSINDDYGKHIGDTVIIDVATTIENNCRESDSIFRFNREEFIVLLPQTNKNDALKVAMKIHNKISNAPIFCDGLIIEVSTCGGVAQLQKGEVNIENTLKRADAGLQEAKKQGRNGIILGEY
ncbi:GGDEF domain-containing protein [Paraglaciecola sp. L3A3]|uniref:GGDEF domain-containing protein n=1 Tax=Paraglaciecola sp. L3A3 TaxID=2686358 RepID=UPI00131D8254|nr:GGDEF domain-containing protein [Paraglaciecola sp. L3A3]